MNKQKDIKEEIIKDFQENWIDNYIYPDGFWEDWLSTAIDRVRKQAQEQGKQEGDRYTIKTLQMIIYKDAGISNADHAKWVVDDIKTYIRLLSPNHLLD